jgi:homoaconitase
LSNISENLLITAVNDEGGEVNVAIDSDGRDTIPNIAKRYKSKDQPWMLVVDDVRPFQTPGCSPALCPADDSPVPSSIRQNYGEGSAREHAALQPRFYGGSMIVARSFARIHETNLKKQGVLPCASSP